MRCYAIIVLLLSLVVASEPSNEVEAAEVAMTHEPMTPQGDLNAEIVLGLLTGRDLHTLVAASTYFTSFKMHDSPIIKALLRHAAENDDIYFEAIDNGPSHEEKAASPELDSFKIVHTNPVEYLRHYPSQIDFILLDTTDTDYMQLRTLMVAYNRMHSKSMVMADGCGLGHCNLVELYLTELGWMTVFKERQLLMVPGEDTIIGHK